MYHNGGTKAGYQGTCHTDDITGTDRGSQCGAQRLELGNGLISGLRMFRYMPVVKDAARGNFSCTLCCCFHPLVRIFSIFPRRLSVNFFEQVLKIVAVVEAVFQSNIRDGTVGGKKRRLGVFEPYIV